MTLTSIIRIRVVGLMPNLWWLGASPWPSLPAAPDVAFCCCDDGPSARVTAVLLHMPRNAGDPAATVVVQTRDEQWGQHLMDHHGFSFG